MLLLDGIILVVLVISMYNNSSCIYNFLHHRFIKYLIFNPISISQVNYWTLLPELNLSIRRLLLIHQLDQFYLPLTMDEPLSYYGFSTSRWNHLWVCNKSLCMTVLWNSFLLACIIILLKKLFYSLCKYFSWPFQICLQAFPPSK